MEEQMKDDVHRVWRALDADTSNFGIRGRYMILFLVFAAAAMAVTLLVWGLLGSLIGMVIGAVALSVSYIAVQIVQGLMTSREFERMLGSMRLASYLRIRPISLRQYFKSNDISWK